MILQREAIKLYPFAKFVTSLWLTGKEIKILILSYVKTFRISIDFF